MQKYKNIVLLVIISSLILSSFVGCSNVVNNTGERTQRIRENSDAKTLVNKISQTIRAKRASGYIAQRPASIYNVPVDSNLNNVGDSQSVGDKLDSFYKNPEEALTEIANEEQGLAKLELIDAIYSEKSVDVIAEKIGQLDAEKKIEYENKLNEMTNSKSNLKKISIDQGLINKSTGKLDLSKIKISPYINPASKISNEAFTWESIKPYYGLCATALAGEMMFEFIPDWSGWVYTGWLRWIGCGIAFGAYAGMTVKVGGWVFDFNIADHGVTSGSDGGKSISAENLKLVTEKLLAVFSATLVPVGFSYYMPRSRDYIYNNLENFFVSLYKRAEELENAINKFKKNQGIEFSDFNNWRKTFTILF